MIQLTPEIDNMSSNSVTTEYKSMNTGMEEIDLEDGEIESDAEEETMQQCITNMIPTEIRIFSVTEPKITKGKSKRPKEYKKSKRARATSRNVIKPNPVEDDWASNVQNAIANAIKKDVVAPKSFSDDEKPIILPDKEKRRKKRKKNTSAETSKKKKKLSTLEEKKVASDESFDEDELLGIRGASPVTRSRMCDDNLVLSGFNSGSNYDSYGSDNTYDSDTFEQGNNCETYEERKKLRQRNRENQRRSDRKMFKEKRRGGGSNSSLRDCHPLQDPDGICIFYMQGKCQRGDECPYSHDGKPQRKMELCKFYLMDCCAKRDKCLYLHSDFPCKFYHTGLQCFQKGDCKFAHGKPLSEAFKLILLKHIETAPKEILGDFPRLSREGALNMVNATQIKLIEQLSPKGPGVSTTPAIPSLFDITVPKPQSLIEEDNNRTPDRSISSHDKQHKVSPGVRKTRWCDAGINSSTSSARSTVTQYLNLQNLSGMLTIKQITELNKLGIQNLNQLNLLNVLQMNQIGLTSNQITEIQLNAKNIEKLGLGNDKSNFFINSTAGQDLDMRLPSMVENTLITPSACVKDVDMRFLSVVSNSTKSNTHEIKSPNQEFREEKILKVPKNIMDSNLPPVIDFSQYAKDASVNDSQDTDKEDNIQKYSGSDKQNDSLVDVSQYLKDSKIHLDGKLELPSCDVKESLPADSGFDHLPKPQQELFSRILHNQQLQRQRSSHSMATDDETQLEIDENWYSSDDDENKECESTEGNNSSIQQPQSDILQPTAIVNKMGDLSKIDISASVAQLLNSIHTITKLNESPPRSRDPRGHKATAESRVSSGGVSPTEIEKANFKVQNVKEAALGHVSIYDCPSDSGSCEENVTYDVDLRSARDLDMRLSTRNILDTDLRPGVNDTDLRHSTSDTDLRKGSSDVDLRVALPFKPISHYTPATEIEGSINSHPPIEYKVHIVDVPRPNYSEIKRNTPKTQATNDPRLRKIFKIVKDEPSAEVTGPISPTPLFEKKVRIDPRKRKEIVPEIPKTISTAPVLDIQVILQSSSWYKGLSSNHKIMVNQQLAAVSTMLKQFNIDENPDKVLDLSIVHANHVLCSIFNNLGIILNENGQFAYLKDSIGNLSEMDGPNMDNLDNVVSVGGGMNMGPLGMVGGPLGGMYDPRFQGEFRGTPGLLGIAPNIPHGFETHFDNYQDAQGGQFNDNFAGNTRGGYSNFGQVNSQYDNKGGYFKSQHKTNRNCRNFSNSNNYRGRSGERWNSRRDSGRRNFNDRERNNLRDNHDRTNTRRDKSNRN